MKHLLSKEVIRLGDVVVINGSDLLHRVIEVRPEKVKLFPIGDTDPRATWVYKTAILEVSADA